MVHGQNAVRGSLCRDPLKSFERFPVVLAGFQRQDE